VQALLAKELDWPPVWTLGGLLAIWVLALVPLPVGFGIFGPGLALAALALGLWLMVKAALRLRAHGTTIIPHRVPQALVTDGVRRDAAGVLGTGLPVWCDGSAAPPSVAGLTFVGWQEPIACGGVAVFPGDVVVVDEDGAVLIPAASLDAVLAEAPEQEQMEAWIMTEVDRGEPLPGLYPMNDATKARYQAWKDAQ